MVGTPTQKKFLWEPGQVANPVQSLLIGCQPNFFEVEGITVGILGSKIKRGVIKFFSRGVINFCPTGGGRGGSPVSKNTLKIRFFARVARKKFLYCKFIPFKRPFWHSECVKEA